jgi:5-methyltetrahydropteroyltriglutamate--homocysteine methyltransferase
MTSKTLPFHADTVGSYLRSQPLKDARTKFAAGELSREQLTEVEDQEIAKLVQAQLDAGIQVITDGEYRRAFWHIDFLENLNGIEGSQPVEEWLEIERKAAGLISLFAENNGE